MRKEKEEELKRYIDLLKTYKMELLKEPNNFLSTKKYLCYLNNGKIIIREKLFKGNEDGEASIILPITDQNTVILTIQPRVFTKSTIGISLPAGYVEKNEKHIEAARRELLEETGYDSNKLIEVAEFYQDDGIGAAYNKGFIALNCNKVANQKLDESEFIKYFECTIDELLELYERKYILDGGSQLVIEKSKKYLKERR